MNQENNLVKQREIIGEQRDEILALRAQVKTLTQALEQVVRETTENTGENSVEAG